MYWLYIYLFSENYLYELTTDTRIPISQNTKSQRALFIHSKTKARKENNEYAGQNVSFHKCINMVRGWGHDVVEGSAVSVV